MRAIMSLCILTIIRMNTMRSSWNTYSFLDYSPLPIQLKLFPLCLHLNDLTIKYVIVASKWLIRNFLKCLQWLSPSAFATAVLRVLRSIFNAPSGSYNTALVFSSCLHTAPQSSGGEFFLTYFLGTRTALPTSIPLGSKVYVRAL